MLTQEMLSGQQRLDHSPVLRSSPCSLHQTHRSSNMLRKKTLEVLWSSRALLRVSSCRTFAFGRQGEGTGRQWERPGRQWEGEGFFEGPAYHGSRRLSGNNSTRPSFGSEGWSGSHGPLSLSSTIPPTRSISMISAMDASNKGARSQPKTQAGVRETSPQLVKAQGENLRREMEQLRKGPNGASARTRHCKQQPPAAPAVAGAQQALGLSQPSAGGTGSARKRAATATGSADTQQALEVRQPGTSGAGISRKHAATSTGIADAQQAFGVSQPDSDGAGSSWNCAAGAMGAADVQQALLAGQASRNGAGSPREPHLQAQPQLAARQELDELALPPDVHIVDSAEDAQRVAQLLLTKHHDCVLAVDTEVSEIDVTRESPCGHGRVICFSIYGGPDIHFGAEPPAAGAPRQDQLWVDTMLGDDEEEVTAVFEAFRPILEDPGIPKVWHNYSFDRHVLRNHGIECRGFHGDTMHMARLWDSSRQGKGYSLESLTGDKELMKDYSKDMRHKTGMKSLFGRKNQKKDGTDGKLTVLDPVEVLQLCPERRSKWISYSAYDAKATWQLSQALQAKLEAMDCKMDADLQPLEMGRCCDMWEMYQDFWRPFGELLTDMEKEGMMVNRQHLAEAQKRANVDQEAASELFKRWASSKVPDAQHMNVGSGTQLRQLLYAGVANSKSKQPASKAAAKAAKGEAAGGDDCLESERVFKVPNLINYVEPDSKTKKPKKNMDIHLYGLWDQGQPVRVQPEVFTPSGWPAVSTPVLRSLAGKPGAALKALKEEYGVDLHVAEPIDAIDDIDVEADSADAVTSSADEALAEGDGHSPGKGQAAASKQKRKAPAAAKGPAAQPAAQQPLKGVEKPSTQSFMQDEQEAKAKGYGKFYAAFGGEKEGLEACAAIDAICEVGAIDTLLSNFIVPLQGDQISTADGRVHCSLNLNTETGRLSARRPNLQNQPALEKDRYKVRQAFTADVSKGNTLIVADYGQLELRLLAHMAVCQSMISAFKLGGDFHSRTALGMYDHIQDAIKAGNCLLEWDGDGKPPVPLLKEKFASERRKAKVLNFSIAYGKTAFGLSKDWNVSLTEAEETVKRWYSDRREVRTWQEQQRDEAMRLGRVRTMLGRERRLPDAQKTASEHSRARGHALRAAINTPIQGSAADVATVAMLQISRNQRLRDLGWTMLLQVMAKLIYMLQVHDEVILEGPKETAAEAQQLIIDCMQYPFIEGVNPLHVDLVVDSKIADTWYAAK